MSGCSQCRSCSNTTKRHRCTAAAATLPCVSGALMCTATVKSTCCSHVTVGQQPQFDRCSCIHQTQLREITAALLLLVWVCAAPVGVM